MDKDRCPKSREGSLEDAEKCSLLTVPKLSRSISLHDPKSFGSHGKKDSGEFVLSTASEGDLVRYFLSPTHIRRSVSVHDYQSENFTRSHLASKGTFSDDDVFEFPHSRSPISLKVSMNE